MFIIDAQGFQLTDKSFVAKEVALCSVEDGEIAHFLLKPPINTYPDSKSQKYLETSFHGIKWEDGFVPYSNMKTALLRIVGYDKKVMCKGLEKCKFFENLLQRNIIDMDTRCCPKLAKLRQCKVKCLFHKSSYFHCALQNVLVLRLWVKSNEDFAEFVKTLL